MSDKWIFWFEELGTGDNDRVGKKCANLGEMTRLGLRIPPGFAISIDGYERFMAETGAGEEIRQYAQENREHLKEIKNQIIA
ncbi:MAG: PEP/pyruvate-binding domain-containing protein, partial [Candidatus Margulisiibacteriota bacterium]